MIFRVIGAILTASMLSVVLKSYKSEYGALVSLGTTAVVLLWFADYITQGIDYLMAVIEEYNIPSDMLGIMIKCLGIAFISKIACDICLDCGERAMSSKLEICSKFAILITAMPIFKEVLSCIAEFI